MSDKKYTDKDIKEVSWNELVRLRPGMYISYVNNRGFIEMIKGLLTNILSHTKSNRFTISLVGKNKAELRFDNLKNSISDDCAIVYTNPLNPFTLEMGGLNALSENFIIKFMDRENNCISEQKYQKGEIQRGTHQGKELECKSFEFEFELDKEIWKDNFEWDENYITHEIKNFAYLHKNTKFNIHYKVDKEECKTIYHFKNGLKDKLNIEKLNGHGGSYFETEIDEKIGDFHLEAVFAFRDYSVDRPYLESYVNDHYTHENGTHVDGLLKGLTYGVMKYFQKHKLTEVYKISEKGMKENLIAALNIRMEASVFSGCVKNKLANSEIIEPITNYVADLLFKKIEEDEESTKKLIRKFEM